MDFFLKLRRTKIDDLATKIKGLIVKIEIPVRDKRLLLELIDGLDFKISGGNESYTTYIIAVKEEEATYKKLEREAEAKGWSIS
jgi:hypothetical protein